MSTKSKILTIALSLLIISFISCKKDNSNPSGNPETGIKIGQKAPDFTLPDKNGHMVSLSDFDDKLVLIDFWASWCHYCRDENPGLVELYNEYHDQGFEIIGVSTDTDEYDWLNAISDDGLNYVHLNDLMGNNSPVVIDYVVLGIPKMYLLNEDGVIILITSKASDVADFVKNKFD